MLSAACFTLSNNRMRINTDIEGVWNREEMCPFELLSRYWRGKTKKHKGKPNPRQPIS